MLALPFLRLERLAGAVLSKLQVSSRASPAHTRHSLPAVPAAYLRPTSGPTTLGPRGQLPPTLLWILRHRCPRSCHVRWNSTFPIMYMYALVRVKMQEISPPSGHRPKVDLLPTHMHACKASLGLQTVELPSSHFPHPRPLPEHHFAMCVLGIQPIEKGRPGSSDVQITGGGRREAHTHLWARVQVGRSQGDPLGLGSHSISAIKQCIID